MKIIITNDKIRLIGHAGYDDFGKDIVCAGISSILISNVNLLKKFDEKSIRYQEFKDEVILTIKKKDFITKTIIDNMLAHFKEIANDYPKNVEIKEEK